MHTNDCLRTADDSSAKRRPHRPFIHLFQTTNHYYVYDVNTNRIIQVDDVMSDLLALNMGWSPTEELESRLPQYGPPQVQAAARRCDELHSKLGVLSSFKPKHLRGVDPRGQQKALYERGLQQLIIEMTQACNLRCTYCSYSSYYPLNRDYTSKTIEFADAQKSIDYFLDRIADTETPSIGFYGGEPLLRFDLLRRCIDYALEASNGQPLRFSLTTNGTLITRQVLDYFIDRSVTLLISLDGPSQCHDRNRVFANGRPTGAAVLDTLDMIKRVDEDYYKKHIGITSVIAPNADPMAFFEFFKSHPEIVGNGVLVSSFVNDSNTDYWEQNVPSSAWCQSLAALRWQYYRSVILGDGGPPDSFLENLYRDQFLKIYRRPIERRLPNFVSLNGCCMPGTRRLYVDCDGRFHMCERINNTIPIGDVDRGIEPERVASLVDEYRSVSEGDCRNCWLLRFCSICFASCVKDGCFDIKHKRSICKQRRDSFHQSLVDYCQIVEINPAAFKYMDDIVTK